MKGLLIFIILCLYCFFSRFPVVICGCSELFRNGKIQPIILVHGGAGEVPADRIQGKINGVKQAVRAGYEQLLRGGSALDAVEAAVVSMENDEHFNAGYGSVLNIRGEIEMEAAIMRGEDLNVGAVTLVKDFRHPISIARKVLTDSPYCILGGEGVKIFADEHGFEETSQDSLKTQYSIDALNEYLAANGISRAPVDLKHESGVDTVGAVAIDAEGHIAAATSTGGLTGKAVGRIGDVTQIGCGTYADDLVGGVSSTGHGESILKYGLANKIIHLMENGEDANTATNNAVKALTARLNNTAGAITLSKDGEIGFGFSTGQMSWAYVKNNTVFYGIFHDEILQESFY